MTPGSPSLAFALVPDSDDAPTRAAVDGICAALGALVDLPVRAVVAGSPAELVWAFAEGRVDVAWVSPILLLTSLSDTVPLVHSVRDGAELYHGVLFVPEGSPCRSPMDLRGKRAAWVAQTSAAGYIFPRLSLASHGLDPRGLFASEAFVGSHGAVARAVLGGEADVGACYAVFERGDAGAALQRAAFLEEDCGKARVLFTTPAIPADLIVAARRLDAELRQVVSDALTVLTDDPLVAAQVAHVIGAQSFSPFRPGELDGLRAQIDDGRMLGLVDE